MGASWQDHCGVEQCLFDSSDCLPKLNNPYVLTMGLEHGPHYSLSFAGQSCSICEGVHPSGLSFSICHSRHFFTNSGEPSSLTAKGMNAGRGNQRRHGFSSMSLAIRSLDQHPCMALLQRTDLDAAMSMTPRYHRSSVEGFTQI